MMEYAGDDRRSHAKSSIVHLWKSSVKSYGESEAQSDSRLSRVEDTVIPESGSGVVRITFPPVLVENRTFKI